MRGKFGSGVISGSWPAAAIVAGWYSMERGNARKTRREHACQDDCFAYHQDRKLVGLRGQGMTDPTGTYRVSAYNTSRTSDNKIHDDTVARRFGFKGGLVPGVDVIAYMLHLPVAKWGRGFLERGLIEARFVKPVYDGETAEVSCEERDGVLSLQVESRGEPCATGSASLPASAPSVSISDFSEAAAVSERRPVNAASYPVGKWLGTLPRALSGDAARQYLEIFAKPARSMRKKAWGTPACCCGPSTACWSTMPFSDHGFMSAAGCRFSPPRKVATN